MEDWRIFANGIKWEAQAFLESTSFEDAIRNAISIGGDSDTIAAITGAVAGAYYGVPMDIRAKAETFLTPDLADTLHKCERMFAEGAVDGGKV